MRSKYGNRKITVGGETFDSRREYDRYRELVLLARAGKIHDLVRQVKFELVPAQYEAYDRYSEKTGKRIKDGKRCVERAVYYIADFVYWDGDTMIVEDAKGYRTDEYRIKKKLLLLAHGIHLKET